MARSPPPTEYPDYVCNLSPELVKKARDELNELPERRAADIHILRDKIYKNPKLAAANKDDTVLLRFLRARKFNIKRAYETYKNYHKIRRKYKDFFHGMRPSKLQHVYDRGIVGTLPFPDKEGRQVVVSRPGLWNPTECPIQDVMRAEFLIFEKIIQKEEVQINGCVAIDDLAGIGWHQLWYITPSLARMWQDVCLNSFPCRFKGVHYLHEPVMFDVVMAIVRPFASKKVLQRVHIHGHDPKNLVPFFGEHCLPGDWGGKLEPIDVVSKTYADIVVGKDEEFDKLALSWTYGKKKHHHCHTLDSCLHAQHDEDSDTDSDGPASEGLDGLR